MSNCFNWAWVIASTDLSNWRCQVANLFFVLVRGSLTFLFLPKIPQCVSVFPLDWFWVGEKAMQCGLPAHGIHRHCWGLSLGLGWHPPIPSSPCHPAILSASHLVPSISYCHPGIMSSSPSLIFFFYILAVIFLDWYADFLVFSDFHPTFRSFTDLAEWWMRHSRMVDEIWPSRGWDLAEWWMRSNRVVNMI